MIDGCNSVATSVNKFLIYQSNIEHIHIMYVYNVRDGSLFVYSNEVAWGYCHLSAEGINMRSEHFGGRVGNSGISKKFISKLFLQSLCFDLWKQQQWTILEYLYTSQLQTVQNNEINSAVSYLSKESDRTLYIGMGLHS
jgi:hypothetical protein